MSSTTVRAYQLRPFGALDASRKLIANLGIVAPAAYRAVQG